MTRMKGPFLERFLQGTTKVVKFNEYMRHQVHWNDWGTRAIPLNERDPVKQQLGMNLKKMKRT